MLNGEDYKEPSCVLCGGKEFYNPDKNQPKGRIPVMRIIEKVNDFFNKNDMPGAGSLLEYWEKEAQELGDKNGELSIQSELIGFYRKNNKKELAEKSSNRALELIKELNLEGTVSAATLYLNIATALKAFGSPEKAVEYYEKTLEIYNSHLDKNDTRFAGLFNNMALALVDLKKFDEATEKYFNAIEIMSNNEDGEPDEAISYVNLAHLYYDKGDDKNKIEDCLFKAYELLNKDGIKENGYLAYVLEKCAPSYGFFGFDFIEKEMKERSVKLYERS
ncbi:MAG: tetratricopeptide repeat protein [Clostridia bacterium]|nr:tetratricopeptide repeat protein [Clostridia bacterium]